MRLVTTSEVGSATSIGLSVLASVVSPSVTRPPGCGWLALANRVGAGTAGAEVGCPTSEGAMPACSVASGGGAGEGPAGPQATTTVTATSVQMSFLIETPPT